MKICQLRSMNNKIILKCSFFSVLLMSMYKWKLFGLKKMYSAFSESNYTSNIITDIGAILQNKHVNMSNNNIT